MAEERPPYSSPVHCESCRLPTYESQVMVTARKPRGTRAAAETSRSGASHEWAEASRTSIATNREGERTALEDTDLGDLSKKRSTGKHTTPVGEVSVPTLSSSPEHSSYTSGKLSVIPSLQLEIVPEAFRRHELHSAGKCHRNPL
jgi:hypothetical protein